MATEKFDLKALEAELDFFMNFDAQDPHSQLEKICEEIDQNWKFPTQPIVNLVKHRFRLEHELGYFQVSFKEIEKNESTFEVIVSMRGMG